MPTSAADGFWGQILHLGQGTHFNARHEHNSCAALQMADGSATRFPNGHQGNGYALAAFHLQAGLSFDKLRMKGSMEVMES